MKKYLLPLALGALTLLSGCASVPMASLDEDKDAKKFTASSDKSNIYFYRNESIGGAIAMTVSLDGRMAGKTGPQTYFLWRVDPGKHEVASHTENTAKIVLDTKAGNNYYVWQEVKMGMWAPRSQLHEVNAERGQKAVKECKMANSEL
ncbi:DUF2846 domain-containing protein [Pseudomonadota bacterium]